MITDRLAPLFQMTKEPLKMPEKGPLTWFAILRDPSCVSFESRNPALGMRVAPRCTMFLTWAMRGSRGVGWKWGPNTL